MLRATPKSDDKVAIVTLGGAGHEPALSGFVGEGLLDASVVGDIFAAPGAPAVIKALKSISRDAGTLLVILNHAGDVLSGSTSWRADRSAAASGSPSCGSATPALDSSSPAATAPPVQAGADRARCQRENRREAVRR